MENVSIRSKKSVVYADAGHRRAGPVWDVYANGEKIGVVYSVHTTKTGFRGGRCVGQVSCKAWRGRLLGEMTEGGEPALGEELGEPQVFGMRGWASKSLRRSTWPAWKCWTAQALTCTTKKPVTCWLEEGQRLTAFGSGYPSTWSKKPWL